MQSKTRLLTDVQTLLKKHYRNKPDRDEARLPILSAVIYGICHEDTTREQANQALARFNDEFIDWNEVRVSSVSEIQETLAGIPEPEEKARKIRRFLRQLFSRTYGFTLESLAKKPLKEALKVLETYEAFESDFVTATVVQLALGGHAIPIDHAAERVLRRLGLEEADVPSLRGAVERAIPKNRAMEFCALIEELASDTCKSESPDCPHCELKKLCPYPQSVKEAAKPAKKGAVEAEASKASKAAHPKAPAAKPAASARSAPTTKPNAKTAAAKPASPPTKPAKPAPKKADQAPKSSSTGKAAPKKPGKKK